MQQLIDLEPYCYAKKHLWNNKLIFLADIFYKAAEFLYSFYILHYDKKLIPDNFTFEKSLHGIP